MSQSSQMFRKVYVTVDEEYSPLTRVSENIIADFEKLKMDSYNEIYVVTVTIDRVKDDGA